MSKHKSNRAVSALIFKGNKCLLLKRRNLPKVWGPPGGRVFTNETMLEAIHREIKEETGLNDIDVLMPITFWAGKHGGTKLEAVTFLCHYNGGKIILSSEHETYKWLTLSAIRKIPVTHSFDDFKRAFKVLRVLSRE